MAATQEEFGILPGQCFRTRLARTQPIPTVCLDLFSHPGFAHFMVAADRPNAARPNLQVMVNATVSRILWGKSKNGKAVATGVEYINAAGEKLTVVRPSSHDIRHQSKLTRSLVRRSSYLKCGSLRNAPGPGA
jgi:hypothetical protein